ncbi:MAG: hypothetical protein HYY93_01035 [Planctomycetes bacterium]|nr:hypothetical protein [Planctomycetota bacterium]
MVDASGSVIPVGMKGWKGLSHLATLQVSGTVKRDAAGNVTLLATAFAIQPPKKHEKEGEKH